MNPFTVGMAIGTDVTDILPRVVLNRERCFPNRQNNVARATAQVTLQPYRVVQEFSEVRPIPP